MTVTQPAPTQPAPLSLFWGYVGILTAVVIWAGWIVATREAMLSRHQPLDVALLRYCTPALLLAPIWMRKGVFPKGESLLLLAIMTAGWGGPFVLLISQGMKSVEASLFGPLVPGLLPMVVALWERFVEGRRIRFGRLVGLGFISAAVVLILGPAALAGDNEFLWGAPWLLAACAGWSAFTIAYRRTNLTGIEAAAYVCLYSTPFLLTAAVIFGTKLQEFTPSEVVWQIIIQGVLSGTVAFGAYGFAIKRLGLARASAFTSLVPVMAAIGGFLILSEAVGIAGWAASACACVGVLLVNRYAA
jgi:drug/metabolite transporter (DMT)-like permease